MKTIDGLSEKSLDEKRICFEMKKAAANRAAFFLLVI